MSIEDRHEEDQASRDPKRSSPWLAGSALAGFVFTVISVGLWIEALTTRTSSAYVEAASITCASIAFVVATYWLLKLAEAGVHGAELVAATTTIRAITVSWLFLLSAGLLVIIGAVTGLVNITEPERRPITDAANGLWTLVGPVSLIALASNGYTEYRRALEDAATTAQAISPPQHNA